MVDLEYWVDGYLISQAEKVAAGMIAERRMSGSIDQIDGVVYFKSKFYKPYPIF